MRPLFFCTTYTDGLSEEPSVDMMSSWPRRASLTLQIEMDSVGIPGLLDSLTDADGPMVETLTKHAISSRIRKDTNLYSRIRSTYHSLFYVKTAVMI